MGIFSMAKMVKNEKKLEEMHKKMCISSFFFCRFALKCKLGICICNKKRQFFL